MAQLYGTHPPGELPPPVCPPDGEASATGSVLAAVLGFVPTSAVAIALQRRRQDS